MESGERFRPDFSDAMNLRLSLVSSALLLLGAVSPLAAQVRLFGRVADDGSGEPIAGARVILLDDQGRWAGVRTADDLGTFEFVVKRSGPYRLRAARLGYRETTTPPLDLGEHAAVRVEVRLLVDAVLLAPLEVLARSPSAISPVLANFHARRAAGAFGRFVTRDEIERLRPGRVTDVLARLPGVRLESTGGAGNRRAVFLRSDCPALIFLDGFLLNRAADRMPAVDDVVSPGAVEGIEIYGGFGTVPAEFLNPESRCGVVAIWTRRGG